MKYREKERRKAVEIRNKIFKDPGNGMFFGKEREFVLEEPSLNLWEGIREDVKHYFENNKITWWKGEKKEPTGHLLSSQVACINHLYFARQRNDVATKILETIHSDINKALILDSGYLEFEFIGEKPYLGEKSFTRGSNCTSIDAVMYGQDNNKKKILFLIEWKYTEEYSIENKYILERSSIYDKLILSNNSPFKEIDPKVLYYEPFYQMMRQTLLGCKLKENKDHKCDDYIHVHVIPDENIELRNKITSPGLRGSDISEAWKSTLKNPYKYKTLSPMKLIEPCSNLEDTNSIISYLKRRYW